MRTTAEERKRNDQRIIEAAVAVFSEKGYEAASMQDIADRAGISRGPLYYRYKTKKDIFLAAFSAYANEEMVEHARLLRQAKPFPEKIRDYLFYATRYLREDKPMFPMDISGEPHMEDINDWVRQVYARSYEMIRESVRYAVAAGELKPDTDVDHLVTLLFIAFDGLWYSRLKSGILASPKQVEAAVEHIALLFQTGYGIL